MSLRTRLCERLGIDCPIVQAPMAGPTTPELAAAVSGAGGLGMLAAARLGPEDLRAQIRTVRSLTDRPFGVNFLVAPPEPPRDPAPVQEVLDRFRAELGLPAASGGVELPPSVLPEMLEVCVEERVPLLSGALGDPTPILAAASRIGVPTTVMVTTVDEATRVVALGAEIVVAQGGEAGGHRSALDLGPDEEPPLVGTLSLVPQVVDAVDVPVVAAGGIVDGRGVVAALALGAEAAQLGTRFLVSRESAAFPAWKGALVNARSVDMVLTRAFTGRPARAVRNQFSDAFAGDGPRPLSWPHQSVAAGDVFAAAQAANLGELFPLYGGQTPPPSLDQPAAEIVAELVEQASSLLARLGKLTG